MELLISSKSLSAQVSSLLSASIHSFSEEASPMFADMWVEVAGNSSGTKRQLYDWVESAAQSPDSALNRTRAVSFALAGLLRLRSAQLQLLDSSSRLLSADSVGDIELSEETAEQALRYIYAVLNMNFLSTAAATAAERTPSSSKAKGGKGQENLLTRAVGEMVSSITVVYIFLFTIANHFGCSIIGEIILSRCKCTVGGSV